MMNDADRTRLEALIQGAFAAPEGGNVAVMVRDLRWLVCLADSLRQPAGGVPCRPTAGSDDSSKPIEENHDREAE